LTETVQVSCISSVSVSEMHATLTTIHTGAIDTLSVRVALRTLGFEPSKEEIKKMIHQVSKDNSETLDFSEFLNLMIKKMVSFQCNKSVESKESIVE
jgi:Ca2+-binding EF-hand superfamily protein